MEQCQLVQGWRTFCTNCRTFLEKFCCVPVTIFTSKMGSWGLSLLLLSLLLAHIIYYNAVHDDIVAAVLAVGTKVCWFKPIYGRWISNGNKSPQHEVSHQPHIVRFLRHVQKRFEHK
jgi:hypothetical protein